ncbi:MAG TPA: TfoX/Sxy family protein [Bryobacteraceae bacterium]|nr:TfoX/Sxy family protein [Bryobacteraceae bacterium]
MGYDETTAERVRRILSGRRDVVEKKMVGGLSFLVNGRMCCGVTSTGLMIRVGPAAYDRVVAQPHVRPIKFGGRPLGGFVCIDPEGYRTGKALTKWVQRGIDFASTLPAKGPRVNAVRTARSEAARK